ncbi:ester cyclase [Pseudomonas entomophila]|uniref:ester cyclase n=1 Tax=Pseudomonas entomophila TaxID=312306 RepID=UPI001BCE5897|nr:ester cyclase [Pseudomonas entomophila]QVM89291.1 ester cyclase [Pseudomonas entomophila]
MNTESNVSGLRAGRWLTPLLLAAAANLASAGELVAPAVLVVDHSLPKAQLEQQILAARRYDTFWNTGDEAMARAALAADFRDNTLPAGRPQGVEGPLKASKAFRAAVPDLRCEVLQMIVAGDRVTAALRFTGHFTGKLGERQGQGEAIDFIAMDIYRIADGRIAEDWHLEDNLTFLQQAGLAAR